MKIFGIGFHKTGTTTLGACLRRLGYKHLSYQPKLWDAFEKQDFEPIFHIATQFDSFDDWPWPLLYEKLDARFQESKFVLTVRTNSAVWLQSLLGHAERKGPSRARQIVYAHPMPHGYEAEHIARYEAHNEAVQAFFAQRSEQLLVLCWENGHGWAELCGFLGLPPPNEPLPHLNRRPVGTWEIQQWRWQRIWSFSRRYVHKAMAVYKHFLPARNSR